MLTIASVAALIGFRYSRNTFGSAVGRPSCGSRACRWMTEAPASTAAMESLTTSSTVNGRCGDMVGVWLEPVTAHVMMTLRVADMTGPSLASFAYCERSSHIEKFRHEDPRCQPLALK